MAPRVVRSDLTDRMKERLKAADPSHLEKGNNDDPTRLIDSWKGATKEENEKLESLFRSDPEHYKNVANVKNKEYETFGVFTNHVLGQKLQNLKQKAKNAAAKTKEGTFFFVIVISNDKFVACSNNSIFFSP